MQVVSSVKDLGLGGGGYQDLRKLLQGGSAGSALIWLGDLGDDPLGWTNPGGFPQHGGTPSGGDQTTVKLRGDMGVSTICGGNVGGRPG